MNRGARGFVALVATTTALIAGQAATGSAQAATITVAPASPACCIGNPFGQSQTWAPTTVFVYKDIPAFNLQPGDTIAFDLVLSNDVDIQLEIDMSAATSNGSNQNAGSFTQIVPNSQLPANPRGNGTTGDYELRFTATAPFDFAGGGLLLRFSNPGGAFAGDLDGPGSGVLPWASSSDTSGHFVEEEVRDPDGVYPWTGDTYSFIGGFQLNATGVPPTASTPPTPTPPPPLATTTRKKRCKKHKRRSAAAVVAKKCKKKKR